MNDEDGRLEVSTPAHPMAIAAYVLAAIFGVSALAGAPSESVAALLGRYSLVWGLGLAVCAVLAIAASLSADRRMSKIHASLRAEMVGVAGTGFSLLVYLYAAIRYHALLGGMGSKLMTLAFVIGAAIRVAMILRELRRLRAAERTPPPELGE